MYFEGMTVYGRLRTYTDKNFRSSVTKLPAPRVILMYWRILFTFRNAGGSDENQ